MYTFCFLASWALIPEEGLSRWLCSAVLPGKRKVDLWCLETVFGEIFLDSRLGWLGQAFEKGRLLPCYWPLSLFFCIRANKISYIENRLKYHITTLSWNLMLQRCSNREHQGYLWSFQAKGHWAVPSKSSCRRFFVLHPRKQGHAQKSHLSARPGCWSRKVPLRFQGIVGS